MEESEPGSSLPASLALGLPTFSSSAALRVASAFPLALRALLPFASAALVSGSILGTGAVVQAVLLA